MKKKYLFFIILFWFLISSNIIFSQDLGVFDLKKGITASGGVNFNAVGYTANGIDNRRDPLQWFATGSINLNLFGYSAPFSFSYSNVQSGYTQPFNQFKFAPQYKWIKTYIGNTAMTFSNYTLAGHFFSGFGVDLTPNKWKISLMYGRLKKAVEYDLADTTQHRNASFRRMGYGLKVGYESEKGSIGIIFFRAKDDEGSLPFTLQTNPITPQQNVAIALSGKKKFGKFSVDFEYSVSALNTNTRADASSTPISNNNLLKGLLPQNATSRYFDAFQTSLGYQATNWGVQFKYERIAPEYQTLGAYFFNNDMENYTIAPNVKLLKGKLNISANAGLQRNNLDEMRQSTTRRFVSSYNISYAPNQKWNFSGSYSNFSTFTRVRPRTDPFFQNQAIDSLNFYQTNNTANGTVSYMFGKKEAKQSIIFTTSYQTAKDQTNNQSNAPSRFYTGNIAYSYSLPTQQLTLSSAINAFLNTIPAPTPVNGQVLPDTESKFLGPSLSISKTMMNKKLRTSLTSAYNYSITNGNNTGDVVNGRLNISFTPPKSKEKKKSVGQTLSLSINFVQRLGDKAYNETTANFNYGLNF